MTTLEGQLTDEDPGREPLEVAEEDDEYLELDAEENWRVGFDRWRRGIRLPVVAALAGLVCAAGVLSVVVLRSLDEKLKPRAEKAQTSDRKAGARPKTYPEEGVALARAASKGKPRTTHRARAAARHKHKDRSRRARRRPSVAQPSAPTQEPAPVSQPSVPTSAPASSPVPAGGAEEFSPER